MPRPQVEILQSSAEATHEAAPKGGASATDSLSLSIASTPAETFPEKEVDNNNTKMSVSPTNLSDDATGSSNAPRIGTASCWNTLQSIQDSIVETSNAAKASRLSSKVSGEDGGGVLRDKVNESIGVARVGAATCWSSFSKLAWDLTLPDVDANKHSADVMKPHSTSNGPLAKVERLKNMAALSVKSPELPSEEEEVVDNDDDEDGLRVEVIENVDSL